MTGAAGRAPNRTPALLRIARSGAVAWAFAAGVGCGAAFASWSIGINSGSSSLAAALTAPSAPTGVTATCTSATSTTVKVSWSGVARATSYTVWYSIVSAGTGFSVYASGVSGTSYTTGALLSGVTYWFEVQAYTGTNWSGPNSSSTSPGRTIGLGTCS